MFQAPCYAGERYSQLGQDLWVLKHHAGKGTFIDVGASDGVTYSNTYLLERMGWTGVCVEPDVRVHPTLEATREKVVKAAAWSKSGCLLPFNQHADQMLSSLGHGEASVETVSLNDLCDMVGEVTYISLDTEGSEVEILRTFGWDRKVKLWTVEHNHNDERISWLVSEFMSHGYLVRLFHWELVAVLDVG